MPTLTERLDTILINLKVLSKLNVTDRPIFIENNIQIRPYWPYITPIIRTISGESRNDIIYGLKSLMEEIERIYIELLNEIQFNSFNINGINISKPTISESGIYFHSPKESPSGSPSNGIVNPKQNNISYHEIEYIIMHLIRLKSELPKIYESNQKGLNALISTYERSPETISQLDNIISNFKILNKKLENKIIELNIFIS